jgi:hypothetical protein
MVLMATLASTAIIATLGNQVASRIPPDGPQDRMDNGIIVSFDDGKTAFYPATLLYAALPQAKAMPSDSDVSNLGWCLSLKFSEVTTHEVQPGEKQLHPYRRDGSNKQRQFSASSLASFPA